jgi:hypothetical protein
LAIQNIAAHSVVGGVAAVLQGGKFGHGFLSSMVSTSLKVFMKPATTSFGNEYTRTLISSIVGGTMSHLTGGSFANGAITSALQWWFNAEGGGTKANSLRETKEQRELRLSGDVEGYYKARAAAGDAYAARALMVVQNQCTSVDACFMSIANIGLAGTALINFVEYDVRDVQIRLMNAHADWVAADTQGVPGLLNATQIAAYHHEVFNAIGLPDATFGGTPLTGMLWEAEVSRYYLLGFLDWCQGCDSE